jgi:hypothetical protein
MVKMGMWRVVGPTTWTLTLGLTLSACQAYSREDYDALLVVTQMAPDVTTPDVTTPDAAPAADVFRPPPERMLSWTPGWDDFTTQYTAATSSAVIAQPSPSSVRFTFTVTGLLPNSEYVFSISRFWADMNECNAAPQDFFWPLMWSPCGPVARQGTSRVVSDAGLVQVATGTDGVAHGEITLVDVDRGTYEIEFYIRQSDSGYAALQAPGPQYGVNTTTIVVPP